jgi:hypothetical protein
MAENTGSETNIHGDVGKLIQIGTVNGNVLIVDEKAVKEALLSSPQGLTATDITEYIKVVVKSNRFGRRVQFQVPHSMSISAFIDLVVAVLKLPWSKYVGELMISFRFRYSVVFGEEKIPLDKTLRDAGISDGDEVQLSIASIWTDEVEEAEHGEVENGLAVLYEMGGRMGELARREAARQARGILTQSRIKSIADGYFEYIDEIGK